MEAVFSNMSGMAKITFSLFFTSILSSCGLFQQEIIPPDYPSLLYGESVSIYSNNDGKDPLGEICIDLDEVGICFTYNLIKPVEFVFDATYLIYRNASFYRYNEEKPFTYVMDISIGEPEYGYLMDKEGLYFNSYLGIKYKDELTKNLQKRFAFDKGINVFHIPLSNDEWYIDKTKFELFFHEQTGANHSFLSKDIFLSSSFAEEMHYSMGGFVFSNPKK